jgi:hypothetical protein
VGIRWGCLPGTKAPLLAKDARKALGDETQGVLMLFWLGTFGIEGFPETAQKLPPLQGSFDCETASLREAVSPLRMTCVAEGPENNQGSDEGAPRIPGVRGLGKNGIKSASPIAFYRVPRTHA